MRAFLVCSIVLPLTALPVCAQPAADAPEFREQREAMVRRYIASGVFGRTPVRDEAVLRAMRTVPRHELVPLDVRQDAYADSPLPIGHGQTISQPYVVAFMTEALRLQPGDTVLEVGTGSGYQAAVLAEIVERVYSIEIVEPLGRRSAQDLRRLGYENVEIRIGDGYKGWPERAPFDAIIVTAAPEHVPQPLLDQLTLGGRLVIPVGESGGVQQLKRITKESDGKLTEETLDLVRFVPMTGEAERNRIREE